MLDLGDLMVFIKVVEAESFTRAGQLLGLPKSTVSRRISRLEDELGTQLLHRTTRAVTVTGDGAIYFEHCMRSIGVLRDAQRALQDRAKQPSGVVRIAVTYVLGQDLICPRLPGFLDLYPDVRLVSVMTDDPVALLKSGFDVALAPGPFVDSGLTGIKIGQSGCGIFASPEYLERNGTPQAHIELPRFDLLANGTFDRLHAWTLHRAKEQVTVEFKPRLMSNDLMFLRNATLSGLGIATLPAFMCKQDLARGDLAEVLPSWRTADMTFFALFADPKSVPLRVRSLIDFLVEKLRPILSWEID